MLIIAWQYLTGRCVATDFADRNRAEWPPHPDRVFQALVASWGERGEDKMERKALEWLERQTSPTIVAPEAEDEPTPVQVYVPVNDTGKQGNMEKGHWKSFQPIAGLAVCRDRKERCFPYVRVGDGICALVWDIDAPPEMTAALERICSGVTRIGHSSSLVRCWLTTDPALLTAQPDCAVYRPVCECAARHDHGLRSPGPGRIAELVAHHRDIIAGHIGDILPPRACEVGYELAAAHSATRQGNFVAPVWVFRQCGGSRLGLRQTLDVTRAFRHALMARANDNPALLQVVSGHDADGAPLKDKPHLAYIPLAFVGHPHADGHLVGMALALPDNVAPAMEDALCGAVGALVEAECKRTGNADNDRFRLVLGRKGEMLLATDTPPVRPWNLRSETWCRPSRTWASTTPIVMDRMQNTHRHDPAGWAAKQIARMCARQGIPEPTQVLIRPVSFLSGSPTVHEFPPMQRKSGGNIRMVHALLTFAEPVMGPLLLGAGRFKGYGLCRPTAPFRPTDGSTDALSLVNAEPHTASTIGSESAPMSGGALP